MTYNSRAHVQQEKFMRMNHMHEISIIPLIANIVNFFNVNKHSSHHMFRVLRNIIVTLCIATFFAPSFAFAANSFVATPAVIDGKGKVREILHYSMTLVNTTKHLVTIYPWVTDLDSTVGESGVSDLAGTRQKELGESLARWIEITRGSVDLLPGEQKDISVTIQVNMNAKPGTYHAVIHLSAGGDRVTAEANLAETVDTQVNIEVLDDINERLQLNTFMPGKSVFAQDSATFSYNIENIGNRGETPRGKIRIYDKKGKEIASIDANQESKKLEPSAKQLLSAVWSSGDSFGRYKAMLDLEYGARGTLQDTVFFWVIPWKKLLGMFFSIIVLCVAVAIVLHSYGQSRRRQELVIESLTRTRSRFWNILPWGSDDDEYEDDDEEEWEEVAVHTGSRVNELREVPLPPPVHTKLFRESVEHDGATHLSGTPKADFSSHKVILGKREAPKPSKAHIVNLKR